MIDNVRLDEAAGCGHPGCKPDDLERQTRDAAAAVLGDDELVRVCAQEIRGVKPDFRSRRHSLEIERLTSPALLKFFAAPPTRGTRVPTSDMRSVWHPGLLAEAAKRGIEVRVFFVGLDSADAHIERVRQRVRAGGHDIPEAAIRRR